MTIKAKSLRYYLSFVVHLLLWRLSKFLKQWFYFRRGFPFGFKKRLFQVLECGSDITLECFLTLFLGYIYATWVKMKLTYECIIYIEFIFECFLTLSLGYIYATWVQMKLTYECITYNEFIFPSSFPKSGCTLKSCLSSFSGFWKMKKNNVCFNLGLVVRFVLRPFAVYHTAIVTTATAFSFFTSYPCFVWNFCCW